MLAQPHLWPDSGLPKLRTQLTSISISDFVPDSIPDSIKAFQHPVARVRRDHAFELIEELLREFGVAGGRIKRTGNQNSVTSIWWWTFASRGRAMVRRILANLYKTVQFFFQKYAKAAKVTKWCKMSCTFSWCASPTSLAACLVRQPFEKPFTV